MPVQPEKRLLRNVLAGRDIGSEKETQASSPERVRSIEIPETRAHILIG
jgi:hypothetical protein